MTNLSFREIKHPLENKLCCLSHTTSRGGNVLTWFVNSNADPTSLPSTFDTTTKTFNLSLDLPFVLLKKYVSETDSGVVCAGDWFFCGLFPEYGVLWLWIPPWTRECFEIIPCV